MGGFNHAVSVSDVRQVVALQHDLVFGHYGLAGRNKIGGPVHSKRNLDFAFCDALR